MVEAANRPLGKLNFDDLVDELKHNTELRKALIKHLAKEHSREYLAHVNINAGLLHDLSARFVASDKEWQE